MSGNEQDAGRVVFVTGGASGIGKAISETLVRQGNRVVIADLNIEAAQGLADELAGEGGEVLALALNVTDPASVEAAVARTFAHFGALHGAVNNAGIVTPKGPLAEQGIDAWQAGLAVNLSGVFYCMKSQVPAMIAAGGGSIVNMSSICGVVAVASSAAYTAAKHGVVGLTKVAAVDYAARGIRVNAIAPGYVDTPLLASRPPEEMAALVGKHPMGRLAKAEEIADLAAFLLSEKAGFITGSVQLIDGGYAAV